MNNKIKTRIKAVLAIVLSFVAVSSVTPTLFLANTPQVNPGFIAIVQDIPAYPQRLAAILRNPMSPEKQDGDVLYGQIPKADPTDDTEFFPIAKGVEASEDRSYVKIEEGTKIEVQTVTLEDGRTVRVLIPLTE
ncbi:MAG: hypothetical protein ACEQSA_00700 [Weeksellaceae bacterium]